MQEKCFKCLKIRKNLQVMHVDLLKEEECHLVICQLCLKEKKRKFDTCKICEKNLKSHLFKNPWIDYYKKQISLRNQLQDYFRIPKQYIENLQEKKAYLYLLECLIDCRKRSTNPKYIEIEKKIKKTIDQFRQKKRSKVNTVLHHMIEEQKKEKPAFLSKKQNPPDISMYASGYSQEECFLKGIQQIINSFK